MFYISLSFYIIIIMVLLFVIFIFITDGNYFMNIEGWIALIGSVVGIVYFSKTVLHLIRRGIILFEKSIYVQEDIGSKDMKLQYKIETEFKDIEKISLSVNSKNTLNQNMRYIITPMPNIVLHLSDGKENRVNVFYYSKKQVIEIIDYIIGIKKISDSYYSNKSGKELIDELR